MPRLVLLAVLSALAAAALPAAAQAACVSRDRTSNCYEPRGNDALSPPNRHKLRMPPIDPSVRSPRLRKLAPPAGTARRGPNLLRWSKRGPDGRLVNRCIGLSCGPFLRNGGTCRPPLC